MIQRLVASLVLCAISASAQGAISLQLAANYDSTRTTQYPNGDKPVGGCTPPTGFTEVSLGDAGGEICEQSSTEFDFSVSGTSQPANYHVAHKDAGAGDVQAEARVTDSYAGASSNFANIGIGIRESSASTSWLFQCHSLLSGTGVFQVQYGSNGNYTTANGTAGSRPRYCAVTYDVSTGDIKAHGSSDGTAWTEIASTNRAMSDVLCYMGGTSRSTSETLAATLDGWACGATIDAYTPGGGGGGGPTLVTAIENQSLAQGTAFSLDVSANFSGETSFTADLPAGTGLTFNTSTGVFGGTPDLDDVTASPYNVETCGVNGGGTTCDTPQFTVSAVPGDTFTIPVSTSARVFDCNNSSTGAAGAAWSTLGGTGRPIAGDIIVLAGGVHSGATRPIRFTNCAGSASAPLIIRNDVLDNEPAIIRRTSGNAGGFVLQCTNCNGVTVDGTGKFVGADSGTLGYEPTTQTLNKTQAGIIVTRTTGVNRPAAYFKFDGLSCTSAPCVVKGVEVDGVNHIAPLGQGGICFDMNDHGENRAAHPTLWREISYRNNYANTCGEDGGEGFYIGPNQVDLDIPLRNITIEYNIVENPARDGINVKSVLDGTNVFRYNHISGTGQSGTVSSQNQGININSAADWSIYGNVVIEAGGNCGQFTWQDDNDYSPNASATMTVESNIFHECGFTAGSPGRGMQFTRGSQAWVPAQTVTVRNNTVATATGDGANCNSATNATLLNNILAGVVGTEVSGCSGDTNNRKDESVAAQNFVNAGADNFELSATSPACNNSTSNAPDTDYEGEARPQGGFDDQGADESPLC